MKNKVFNSKTDLKDLPRISDRVTFIYIERAKINRIDGAITARDIRGLVKIPAAMIGILMLGPGVEITHRAMELLGDTGTSVIWAGENGVRNYSNGRPLAHSTKLLEKQAKLVSNSKSRIKVARLMYAMRFEGEDVSRLTMQQLRGREGSRIRSVYRKNSQLFDVEWTRRDYNPDNFDDSTPINQALSACHVCLYGLCHSIITALGMAPGLGFVHTGHDKSFVYDIADLYKAETSIPLAFEIVKDSSEDDDIGSISRRKMRDLFRERKIAKQITRDLQFLMGIDDEDIFEIETINLWDEKENHVPYGINYEVD